MTDNTAAYRAHYWHSADDHTIVCDVCPRHCRLKDGQKGFCFVRENQAGQMVLTTYNYSSGFCIDPIEKKPLNHFFPGTPILSFGTMGCNLGCQFCQNWNLSRNQDPRTVLKYAPAEKIAELVLMHGCQSIAFTYNEPLIFGEYAIDVAKACHERGIQTVAVTAGYVEPEPGLAFFSEMDAVNMDLKGFTNEFYHTYCQAQLQPVLDTIKLIRTHTSAWMELTTLVIPDANDSVSELAAMSEWIVTELGPDVPVHFTAFHPDFRLTDRAATSETTLRKARKIALDAGLNYVYTGNIRDLYSASTYCPGCHTLLIERDGYSLGHFGIVNGCCEKCQTPIAGRWGDTVGNWGNHRMPIRLENV